MKQLRVQSVQDNPTRLRDRSLALAVSLFFFEVLMGIMYGLFMRYPQVNGAYDKYGVGLLFCLFILLTVGFGLLLSYIRSSSWSAIGYPLFMLAITVQLYFLVSAFFTKIHLQPSTESFSSAGASLIELTPFYSKFGSSFSGALSCALSVYVSYTAFHGRVGPLELFYHTLVTVIGYEINRQLLVRLNVYDSGGSMGIFVFGSLCGFIVSWMLSLHKKHHTKGHPKYRSQRMNYLYSLLGTAFIWALIPVLSSLATLTQSSDTITNPFVGFAAINVWFALSASTWSAFCMSILLHKRISVQDVAFGSFSGAIAFGSSANVVAEPIAAIVVGMLAGVIGVCMLSYLRRYMNRRGVLNSSGCVEAFMLSGLQGGIWSAIFAVFRNMQQFYTSGYTVSITTDVYTQGGLQIGGLFISAAIGVLAGFLSTSLLRGMNRLDSDDYFDDGLAWTIEDDGLYTQYAKVSRSEPSSSHTDERHAD